MGQPDGPIGGLARASEYCAGTGVTVNAVLPGPTKSAGVDEFVAKMSGGKKFEEFETEFFKSVRPSSLIKRFATTDEVASLVIYVAVRWRRRSPAARPAGGWRGGEGLFLNRENGWAGREWHYCGLFIKP